jgi:hypothetical protein
MIQIDKKTLERWLDVLNYFDSDVCDVAERTRKMGMYLEYEIVQDEIYIFLKKEDKNGHKKTN